MQSTEICYLSAIELVDAFKTKSLSPVEVMDAVLSRIEALNPKINAYCTVAEDAGKKAREAENRIMKGNETGPLHGVPISIKDLIFTRGLRTTGGSKIFADLVPTVDDIAVERLKKAGAIIIGKTNTPEFGSKGVTDNPLFGETHNPWNPAYTPGGSSGGAAAAVASGLGPVAIGTDGGGSIRIPGTFCGVFGFKPSYGRVPKGPGFPDFETLSHTGPITRTVTDAALIMEVIAGRDDRDRHSLSGNHLKFSIPQDNDLKGLNIAWSPDLGYAAVHPQVLEIVAAAVNRFSELECAVRPLDHGIDNPMSIFYTLWGVRFATLWQDKLNEWADRMDPGLVRMIEQFKTTSATAYGRACLNRAQLWNDILRCFQTHDILLMPTVAVPPFELGNFGFESIADLSNTGDWIAFTYPFNLTGLPAATVPCGFTSDDLPIGLQIVGRPHDDWTVLRVAAAFEKISPCADKHPDL